MLSRIYFWLLCAAVLVGLGAGTVWYWLHDRIVAQKATIDAQSATIKQAQEAAAHDRAILASLSAANAAAGLKQATVRLQVDRSLFKNQEWAEQPIPQEVQDALRTE